MKRGLPVALAAVLAALTLAGGASAAQRFVPGQLVVKFAADAGAAERSAAKRAAGALGVRSAVDGVAGAKVIEVAGGVRAAARALERSSAVAYAEPNFIYRALAVPDDARFDQLWGLDNVGQTGGTPDADIDAPEGWDGFGLGTFPASGGAKVGVIDTGIQQSHPDLAGKTADCAGVNSFGISLLVVIIGGDSTIVDGKCGDDNGHGTHVSGTIAARADNGSGVAGVAFNSPLSVCKALNRGGSGTLEMVANCIAWSNERGARVISMSLGGPGSQTLQDSVRNATEKGSLLIAAAGNDGNSSVSYPAGYAEVVSVAATDDEDRRAWFSNANTDVEMAAPGVSVLSTWTGSSYRTASGTSMATPHVAGVAALIAGANPGAGPAAWRSALNAAVDDLGAAGRDPQFGFGRVNLALAAP